MPGILGPRVAREAGDRAESALPLPERPRRRRPFGGGLRPDVRVTAIDSPSREVVQQGLLRL